MSIIETIVFFVLCWWMVLYLTLPFGQKPDEDKIAGQAASAPKNPFIKRKMIATTLLTFIITFTFYMYMR